LGFSQAGFSIYLIRELTGLKIPVPPTFCAVEEKLLPHSPYSVMSVKAGYL
jgi:hypothetical protein